MGTRAAFIFAGAALLAVGVATLLLRNAEPRYQGRTLEQWEFRYSILTPDDPKAREAMVVLATNHLLFLIQILSCDTSPRRLLEAKLPKAILNTTLVDDFVYRRGPRRRAFSAAQAIQAAGTNAVAAIAPLTALAKSSNESVAVGAVWALTGIGPPALPAVRELMRSTNHFAREAATNALEELHRTALTNTPAQ
jgi:hypothetical protein